MRGNLLCEHSGGKEQSSVKEHKLNMLQPRRKDGPGTQHRRRDGPGHRSGEPDAERPKSQRIVQGEDNPTLTVWKLISSTKNTSGV